ncbi:hypothetical protein M3Y94_00742000 [Aphelenchoides besseyi]|nr:hypothetical protein M3Y94_00742000 [Aphelenchoides besseyi]KAI6231991.1 hypothetical protein M3Y95_00439800 [Aphelenchoides besseyi]
MKVLKDKFKAVMKVQYVDSLANSLNNIDYSTEKETDGTAKSEREKLDGCFERSTVESAIDGREKAKASEKPGSSPSDFDLRSRDKLFNSTNQWIRLFKRKEMTVSDCLNKVSACDNLEKVIDQLAESKHVNS